jgi:hypothetical protein
VGDFKEVSAIILSWTFAALVTIALLPLLYWMLVALLTIINALPDWLPRI